MREHRPNVTIGMRCIRNQDGSYELSYTVDRQEQNDHQVHSATKEKAVEYRDWLIGKFGQIGEFLGNCEECLEGPQEVRLRMTGSSSAPELTIFKGKAVTNLPLRGMKGDELARKVGEEVLRNLGHKV